jgi:hypothetical protein
MKLLVIGSCTGDKDVRDCPRVLTEPDFDNPEQLRGGEEELARWMLPAGRLYTGPQHLHMMEGVSVLREGFGADSCSLQIVSAGYGVVAEDRPLVPYNATFQGKRPKWIRERAAGLGIPSAIRIALRDFPLVVFLLGKEYLCSLDLPLPLQERQRRVFFSPYAELPFGSGSTRVPAGKPETRFGASTLSLKGRMFHLLALGLASNPARWDSLLADATASTAMELIEEGARRV